jgi:hypothetical protein
MKKLLRFLPLSLVVTLIFFLFKDFFFLNKMPLPGDTLIGAYFPWLDYINLGEVCAFGLEVDLHWTPKTLREARRERNQNL